MWLITGHRGFIGSRLTQRLDALGIPWRGVDLQDGADCRDFRADEAFDVIVHLAAISGIDACETDAENAISHNIQGAARILSHNARAKLFASSQAAAQPDTVYGATKRSVELLFPRACALRFSNIYGPGSAHKTSCVAAWCRAALTTGEIVVHGNGDQTRDFLHVEDAVSEILALAQSPVPGPVSVCSGVLTPVSRVARMIADLTGARIVYDPDARVRYVNLPSRAPLPGLRDLGEGLRETVEYFREVLRREHVA